MTTAPSGLLPVLATPFTDDGGLDEPSLRRLVRFQEQAGVDGMAVFGIASEVFALAAAERVQILRIVRETLRSEIPLIAGVNPTGEPAAHQQAVQAADEGATHLMVLPPYMVKPSPEQLIDFFGALAQDCGLPMIVQDAPNTTGVRMPVELITEFSKLEGVTGCKIESQPSPPKVAALANETNDNFVLLGGQNALFCLEEHAAGAVGTMPACELSDALATVLRDWRSEDAASARHGFNRLLPVIRYGLQPGLAWAVHKRVLVERGIISSARVRMPARPLDAATATYLSTILKELDLPPFQG